jgi:hypothetical protein
VSGYPKYFCDEPNPPAWLKALAEVRRMAPRQGYCFLHVQAITVAIDQYAEAATGNRDYFLDKPYSIGGSRRSGDVPRGRGKR